MAAKRLNVLVYAGSGSTVESVRQCVFSLRRLLSPRYAVLTVTGDAIIKEPWTASCAMLVMPGGADLGYCRTLNGEGNRRISQYVERGGAYLGFCAGGYYGSKRCEFEVGNRKMEVVGDRELGFYPGICRGCAYPGFVYHSEEGARAVELKVNRTALASGTVPEHFNSYYNGGGVFVNAPDLCDDGIEILAEYTKETAVDAGKGSAAVVFCKVGEGAAILTGPHPEFAAVNLNPQDDGPGFPEVVETLSRDDELRIDFLRACLTKLDLKVHEDQTSVPSLSRLHLSSSQPADIIKTIAALKDIIVDEDGEEFIRDENDSFRLESSSPWAMRELKHSLPSSKEEEADATGSSEDRLLDYNAITKRLVLHKDGLPDGKETPYFNHHAYFANLQRYQSEEDCFNSDFGKVLLYGEVVTSTNTLIEKNTQLLRRLPTGFTATATVQVAGRGRGNNVWVSPAGSLMFSLVLRHPSALLQKAPVVFLQYLAALAIVEGVHSYDTGFSSLPIKLKWPNDIYALDPQRPAKEKSYVKIGGILVNSHYSTTEYFSVIGIGLNVTNTLPTTALSALLAATGRDLPAFTAEKLLARLITTFSKLYTRFCDTGFDQYFEDLYYRHWLHTDQIITLESEGGVRARIRGITRDWGLLLAEELGWQDRGTGKIITLQSDSNSFDFFKGLLKRKA